MAKKFRALIVDDSITIRKIIKANLNKLGVSEVYEAANGDEGFKLARNMPLDVVFADYNMPVLNGLEMITKIRGEERTASLKVVAISSEFDENLKDRFRELGVFDFIEKPFDLAKFNNSIKPVLVQTSTNEDGAPTNEPAGAKLTIEMLNRLFSTKPETIIDERYIAFVFGNEKITMQLDKFIHNSSHYLDIPLE